LELSRPLVVLGALTLAFAVFSQAVAMGLMTAADRAIEHLVAQAWCVSLKPPALAVAELGGAELTGLIAVGLAAYLFRRGFRHEAWALLALPLVEVAEVVYKVVVQHPAPIRSAHGDGPSLTMLLERGPTALQNSYPSGHTLRAVLVYGLLAFVIYRLAPRGLVRKLAIPAAAVIISLVALDRLYLGVHWTSDVIGGLLLGGVALAAAVVWLDRPRPVA
jgi:membrane-associated phospholipid phosphatase